MHLSLIAVSFRCLVLQCGKNTRSITSAHRYLPDFCSVAPQSPETVILVNAEQMKDMKEIDFLKDVTVHFG